MLVLLGGHMMDKHLSYVAGSRSRGVTEMVCDHAEVGKDPTLRDAIRTLGRAMSKDRDEDPGDGPARCDPQGAGPGAPSGRGSTERAYGLSLLG